MKKITSLLLVFLMIFILGGCKKDDNDINPEIDHPIDTWVDPSEPVGSNHMIKDSSGNFGGTYNKEQYGVGTPQNGSDDIANSEYFVAPDYYYFKTTLTRTINSKFRPYQQTMADSSGIACILMALNYFGEDVLNTYNEKALVDKYETLTNTKIYKNGTTKEGLSQVLENIGYYGQAFTFKPEYKYTSENLIQFVNSVYNAIISGNIHMIKMFTATGFEWKAIIGLDTMDTESASDDVLIFADPKDVSDHKQDGYSTYPVDHVYRWWLNQHKSGERDNEYQALIVYAPEQKNKEIVEETEVVNPNVPELHLILNADGSYGGVYNEKLYGKGAPKDGLYDHTNTVYYKINDYYNMVNTSSRLICTNFRAFQQTMQSTCGLCSMMGCLAYYGEDITWADEERLVIEFEAVNKKTVYKNGIGATYAAALLRHLGYDDAQGRNYLASSYVNEDSMVFSTYDDFIAFLKPWLSESKPLPISWRPVGGHWEVIIGFDDMGNDNPYDDVIILADSYDIDDHYQDGYNTYNAMNMYSKWYNSSGSTNQAHYYFNPKLK